ncbi:SGNH/GDSL hydrolase family protein [Limibaculum sp. M0105]|uniref:SGNH/GDSL hydrolase family protein n=1 Tax=Thermohalobaculum xanthum TaxID=2753746 RepID=A0A8J7SC37_9RHOB|nr:SGNH/GDSL hydrolase family protein [Thermohalobaculum xanthum]MBK0399257.1 SGNH/GDSL hydrolase family protein [Thermohalobaculum xanthum]
MARARLLRRAGWLAILMVAAVLLVPVARAQTASGVAEVTAVFSAPRAQGEVRVLFLGNSFTREHDVPAQVTALAARREVRLRAGMIVGNGTKLGEHVADAGVAAVIGGLDWDVLVLQDHSVAALTPEGAAASRMAVIRLAGLSAARIILFATWPRAPGHALYGKPGMPAGPAAMNARVRAHYAALGETLGARVAGIGDAFLVVAARDGEAALYAADGYHASAEGARLAASILAAAILAPPRLPAGPTRSGDAAPRRPVASLAHHEGAASFRPRLEFSRAPG